MSIDVFLAIKMLVDYFVPPMYVEITWDRVITAIGVAGLIGNELRVWNSHR